MRNIILFLGLMSIHISLFASTGSYDMTYYSDSFDGGSTALGETFRQDGFSSAMCGVSLGSLIRLTIGEQSLVLKVNDRPNCVKHPDLVDVSKRVFSLFAPLSRGRVSGGAIEVLGSAPLGYEKRILPGSSFQEVGIELDENTPNTYFPRESIHLKGRVTNGASLVSAVITQDADGEHIVTTRTDQRGYFSLSLAGMKKPGKYDLSLFTGDSGDTSLSTALWILDRETFHLDDLPEGPGNFFPPVFGTLNQGFVRIFLGNDFYTLTLSQGDQRGETSGKREIILDTSSFRSGTASLEVSGMRLSTPFSHDAVERYQKDMKQEITLTPQYPRILPTGVRIIATRKNAILRFRSPTSPTLKGEAFVTLPSGDVRSYDLPNDTLDQNGNILPEKSIIFSFPVESTGIYLVEVPDTSGKAWINTPLIVGKNIWPILPSPLTLVPTKIEKSSEKVSENQLSLINALREIQGKKSLISDLALQRVAQEKAHDMLLNEYVGHTDSSGKTIMNRVEGSSGVITSTILGENVAGGNQGDRVLFEGLKLSGSHLYNILYPDWNRVGIGYATGSGKTYLVQVFGN